MVLKDAPISVLFDVSSWCSWRIEHNLKLQSSYRHRLMPDGRPEITTCHSRTALTVDYILYSSGTHTHSDIIILYFHFFLIYFFLFYFFPYISFYSLVLFFFFFFCFFFLFLFLPVSSFLILFSSFFCYFLYWFPHFLFNNFLFFFSCFSSFLFSPLNFRFFFLFPFFTFFLSPGLPWLF